MVIRTDPEEFRRFNDLLVSTDPQYKPFYFALSEKDKDPLPGLSWKTTPRLTFEQASRWMVFGHNIGIAATDKDRLVIIDIDDISITPDTAMLPTLSAYSRKRIGRHYFYFTKDKRCKTNVPTDTAGEIRAVWQYVVAAGSYVPCNKEELGRIPDDQKANAGRYSLKNSIKPSLITYEDFPTIFKTQIENTESHARQEVKKPKKNIRHHNTQKTSALFDLTISDVVGRVPSVSRFPSLFHASETGKNTSISKDTLTCWRHNVTHSPLSALAVMAGVETCQSAGYEHAASGAGTSSIDWTDGETMFRIWIFARREGIIPKDDPMPMNASAWYKANREMLHKKDQHESDEEDIWSRIVAYVSRYGRSDDASLKTVEGSLVSEGWDPTLIQWHIGRYSDNHRKFKPMGGHHETIS